MNKLYLIIINNVSSQDIKKIKKLLGIDKLKEREYFDFYDANLKFWGNCISVYKENFLLIDSARVLEFCSEKIGSFELSLSTLVPNCEIAALYLYSVIDGYGYAVVKNCKRQRSFFGDHEGVWFDFGEELPEEIDLEKKGEKFGGAVVEKLFERYFGNSESEVQKTLMELEFINYT